MYVWVAFNRDAQGYAPQSVEPGRDIDGDDRFPRPVDLFDNRLLRSDDVLRQARSEYGIHDHVAPLHAPADIHGLAFKHDDPAAEGPVEFHVETGVAFQTFRIGKQEYLQCQSRPGGRIGQ